MKAQSCQFCFYFCINEWCKNLRKKLVSESIHRHIDKRANDADVVFVIPAC